MRWVEAHAASMLCLRARLVGDAHDFVVESGCGMDCTMSRTACRDSAAGVYVAGDRPCARLPVPNGHKNQSSNR